MDFISKWNEINQNGKLSFHDNFLELVTFLMNEKCLLAGETRYRLTELEIYYNDGDKHKDPYIHKNETQKSIGKLYYNGYGLDITFGDEEKNVYGGILIRGVKRLDSKCEFINGPANVLKKIMFQSGKIDAGAKIQLIDLETKSDYEQSSVFWSTRIGLTKKAEDTENYIAKDYRFLTELVLEHKFKDKENVVRKLLSDKIINEEDAFKIVGYKFKH